jgi:ADP-ribosylglycohydrolase
MHVIKYQRINNVLSRFRGCLLGAAVGDALGAPLEGLSRQRIRSTFGEVDRFIKNPRKKIEPGQWTDDTALTLATTDSLLDNRCFDPAALFEEMKAAYLAEPWRGFGPNARAAFEGSRPRKHRLDGAGAAMRIAPLALLFAEDLDILRQNVIAACRLTHPSRAAEDGALAVSFLISLSVRGALSPDSAVAETIAFLGERSDMGHKLQEVQELLASPAVTTEAGLEHLGTRGYVLESVGSAVYAFLRTPDDLRRSLISAVNAGGDTDTVGSITGAISGAYNGVESLPNKWLNKLEARSVIDDLGKKQFELSGQAAT